MKSALFKSKLSHREQRLAVAVGLLLVACVVFYRMVMPIVDEWRLQDGQIRTKIARIELLGTILGMEESINAKYDMYKELLAQESTDEAIRNELMQDIGTIGAQSKVHTPEIRRSSTDYYRHYNRYVVEIEFEGAPASAATFLANLQKSKKLFRVERLNVSKKTALVVNGTMEVSRILVPAVAGQRPEQMEDSAIAQLEGEETEKNLIENGDMEVWSFHWGKDRYPDSWTGRGITTARSTKRAVTGFAAAKLAGRSAPSYFHQDVPVDPGSRYQLTAHMALASGLASLRPQDVDGGSYYRDGENRATPIEDKAMRLYTRTFTTLGDPGGKKRVLRVTLLFPRGKASIFVDDVRLVKLVADEESEEEK
jgi:hypothetical protein